MRKIAEKKINKEEPEWVVVLLVVLCLGLGLILKNIYIPDYKSFVQDGLSFEYPAEWVRDISFNVGSKEEIVSLRSLKSYGGLPVTLKIQTVNAADYSDTENALSEIDIFSLGIQTQYKKNLSNWQIIENGNSFIMGNSVKQSKFVYIDKTRNNLPVVVFGWDSYIHYGSSMYKIAFRINNLYREKMDPLVDRVLNSIIKERGQIDED